MGYQVIRQPDGKLAIWTSYSDGWAAYDCTPEEAVEFFVEIAADRARRDAERVVRHVLAGEPRKAYHQFAMTFEEAEEEAGPGERLADLRAAAASEPEP